MGKRWWIPKEIMKAQRICLLNHMHRSSYFSLFWQCWYIDIMMLAYGIWALQVSKLQKWQEKLISIISPITKNVSQLLHVCFSAFQIEEFRRLRTHVKGAELLEGCDGILGDNFRPTQPLSDRVIRAAFQ